VEQQKLTTVYRRNAEAYMSRPAIRRALNEGGSSSSKTISILQILNQIAKSAKDNLLISIVSESLPHLKKACIKDMFNEVLHESQDNNPRWNKTDHIYSYGKGKFEFFGADEYGKVSGPRREILYLNEANHLTWDVVRNLDMRTTQFVFSDWNPTNEFWAHEKWLEKDESGGWRGKAGNAYIHSTYKDAEWVLPSETIIKIEEMRKNDPNGWRIYGLGLLGKVEGLVYPYFEQIETLPIGDYFYGLDFGFAGDEAALVKNVILDKSLYSQQIIYAKNLTNQDLSAEMERAGLRKNYDEIFADSAEPKSIEELCRDGWNVKPCPKGDGSVEFGHQKVLQYKQYWTSDSVDCIKEQRNFRYILDKNNEITQKTTHQWSHGMDARRYGVVGKLLTVGHNPLHIG